MQIYGREVGFLLSVGAKMRINSIKTKDQIRRAAEIAVALSEAHEKRKKLEDKGYEARPLTVEEVLTLTDEEFVALSEAIGQSINEGGETSVETAEAKKKQQA